MYKQLKEVLLPFNAKELEYFQEATKNCSDEQRIAVAKRMSEEKPPEGFQFTEAQIKRFVTQDSMRKINWYPGIKTSNEADEHSGLSTPKKLYDKLLESGRSPVEAAIVAGYTPAKPLVEADPKKRVYDSAIKSGRSPVEAAIIADYTPSKN